jgi:high-affinity nickel-transport protein
MSEQQAVVVNSSVGLSPNEKVKIATVYSSLGLVTASAFVASIWVGTVTVLLAGLGIVSYVLGLHHGMDADHIAAIDNTTRKLMNQHQRPLTVGMWFSLGHSVIVGALVVALIFVTRAVIDKIPALESGGALVGTLVSGVFLFLIGTINLVIVFNVYRTFKELKQGKLNQTELQKQLEKAPPRYFRALFKIVNSPWQIFPIGVLFGLGFDTATQVALIAISVGVGVSSSVPVWMILVLPLMFTCGMVMTDTTDGVTMRMAYGWAFLNPIRKVYYNLTITIISILVAFAIGGIELLQVVGMELNLTSPFWGWFANLDFETLGGLIIVIFLVSWLVSVAIWKYRRIDETYESKLSSPN